MKNPDPQCYKLILKSSVTFLIVFLFSSIILKGSNDKTTKFFCPDDPLICNDLVNISLDENCEAVILPDMILEQVGSDDSAYEVMLSDEDGNMIGNTITAAYIGQTLTVMVSCIEDGNSCWGNILVEDKLAPEITCPDDSITDFVCTDLDALYTPDVTVLEEGTTLASGNPITTDNCGITVTTYEDNLIAGDMCTDDLLIRTFTSTDEYGNTASCTQQIMIGNPDLSDISFPESITLNCAAVSNTDPQALYDAGYDGLPIGTTFFGAFPVSQSYCNIGVSYHDATPIDLCGSGFKILRTWTFLDWCTTESTTSIQIIKVEDTDGPTFTCPVYEDIEAVTTPGVCSANVLLLPVENFDDNCSEAGSSYIEIAFPDGSVQQSQAGDIVNLEAGEYTLTYHATDACDNEGTSCTTILNIIDGTPPVAICDEHTAVSIGADGSAFVCAPTFNDGSYDNCSDIVMKVKRMDASNNTDFADCVEFNCSDVGNEVMVRMRVYDVVPTDGFEDDDDGRFNECMIVVNVADKLDPEIVCPADKTIECQGDFSEIEELSTSPVDGAPVFFNGALAGYYAAATDNCDATVSVTDNFDINSCGEGLVFRTWTAEDDGGRTASCVQTISLINSSPFTAADISWPANHYVDCGSGLGTDPEDLPAGHDAPELAEDACDLVAVTYEDTFLEVSEDACYKVLRKWIVVDWCQFDPADNVGGGYWEYTQIVFVVDEVAPVIDPASCAQTQFCTFEENCGGVPVDLMLIAEDDCAEHLNYSYTINEFDINTGADGAVVSSGNSNSIDTNLPIRAYRVYWSVEDGCGNVSTCDHLFRVIDCKPPTPVLINGLSIVAPPALESVVLEASDFNAPNSGSFDNCTASEDLIFFARLHAPWNGLVATIEQVYAVGTSIAFNCSNTGLLAVEVFVIDERNNWDVAITYVDVQDLNNLCFEAPELVEMAGDIYTENDDMISDVFVAHGNTSMGMPGMMTDASGHYTLQVPVEENYVIVPEKDEMPMNGVTTFDLVLMSKHILGITLLDSPYKIIAADANHSNSITTFDLVQIRRLILGIDETFPNNTSWRFVDAGFVFPDPTNPFLTIFPEDIAINEMDEDAVANDFVGVKIGDVNSSAISNGLVATQERSPEKNLVFKMKKQEVHAGETCRLTFKANDFVDMLGFQFTFSFDTAALSFDDIKPGKLSNLNLDNFGLTLLEEGIITASWNENSCQTHPDHETLFEIHFTALQDGKLSDWVAINSAYTQAEAYQLDEVLALDMVFDSQQETTAQASNFELYQNMPNPMVESTTIAFQLPASAPATLRILDISGKIIKVIHGNFPKGYNAIQVDRDELPFAGIYYYELIYDKNVASKKMIFNFF